MSTTQGLLNPGSRLVSKTASFNVNYSDRTYVSDTPSVMSNYSILWIDVILLSIVSTFNSLIFKSWFVFAGFIDDEYKVNFSFLSMSLATVQLAPIATLFIAPFLNRFKCNWVCACSQIIGMLLVICNSLLDGSIFNLFFLAFVRSFMSQIFWTVGNSVVYHFKQERRGQKIWRKNTATTVFMASWTFSTILLLAVGYFMNDYGFRDVMIMIAFLQLPLSLLLFWRVPSISLNDFIQIENIMMSKQSVTGNDIKQSNVTSELCADLKVLCSKMQIVFLMIALMAFVTVWGMVYGSFGLWLQELFNLDAESLGLAVTVCEAIAECISLCAIPIISRYIANSYLCIIGGICELLSVILLNVLLWNDGYILNVYVLTLDNEYMRMGIVLTVIFLFYMGHDFLYISLLVNLQSISPKNVMNTAIAAYGCFDFIGAFIGQLFVTYVFAQYGMSRLAPCMFVAEAFGAFCLLLMCCKKEHKKIHNHVTLAGDR